MKHACLLASDLLILIGCSTSQPLYSVDNAVVLPDPIQNQSWNKFDAPLSYP